MESQIFKLLYSRSDVFYKQVLWAGRPRTRISSSRDLERLNFLN